MAAASKKPPAKKPVAKKPPAKPATAERLSSAESHIVDLQARSDAVNQDLKQLRTGLEYAILEQEKKHGGVSGALERLFSRMSRLEKLGSTTVESLEHARIVQRAFSEDLAQQSEDLALLRSDVEEIKQDQGSFWFWILSFVILPLAMFFIVPFVCTKINVDMKSTEFNNARWYISAGAAIFVAIAGVLAGLLGLLKRAERERRAKKAVRRTTVRTTVVKPVVVDASSDDSADATEPVPVATA